MAMYNSRDFEGIVIYPNYSVVVVAGLVRLMVSGQRVSDFSYSLLGFAAWNTYDIIDLKLSNRPLLQSSESSWGFCQVLPVVLIASIIISILDAFTGNTLSSLGNIVKLTEKRSKEISAKGSTSATSGGRCD